jgi:serine-type D-Ala-D-Ala carboxypeptidase/endopeptidase (penicillin-binding protein 4)
MKWFQLAGWLLVAQLSFFACKSVRADRQLNKTIQQSTVFAAGRTGFVLTDAQTGRVHVSVLPDQYFIPASNTKILTLATCLRTLGDSIPGMYLYPLGDTLHIAGAGDPTFLHPQFEHWQGIFEQIKQWKGPIVLYRPPFHRRFGSGWCWDDYPDEYQPERALLPLYGQCVHFSYDGKGGIPRVEPPIFAASFKAGTDASAQHCYRSEYYNQWTYPAQVAYDHLVLPFRSDSVLIPLLSDTLRRNIVEQRVSAEWINRNAAQWPIRYSTPIDTVYRRMMYESDNQVAEQLLISAAMRMSNKATDDIEAVIGQMTERYFPTSTRPPRWVDGSGLSRYNAVTPRYLTEVLRELYQQVPQERLFNLFPEGGAKGTIAQWYAGPEGQPFVYAKTGTMSGVHCLSGYLLTKRKKVLVFSFMHNNFTGSSQSWKAEMQRIFTEIYYNY